jgi:hypothetical protein
LLLCGSIDAATDLLPRSQLLAVASFFADAGLPLSEPELAGPRNGA